MKSSSTSAGGAKSNAQSRKGPKGYLDKVKTTGARRGNSVAISKKK